MNQYDFAFSCGYSCGVTQALRAAGLQFASFPFDWTATPSFRRAAETIAGGFARWMDRGDLELVDVRRGGINKHIYRNRRTGFGFVHDFSSYKTFDDNYPEVAEKYERRIERLQSCFLSAKKILAIFVEWPIFGRVSDEELSDARRILSERYPSAEFEVLYFYCEDGCKVARTVSSCDGITVVANDYRTFQYGEINHEMDNRALMRYLRENILVEDPRTPEEKSLYAAGWERQDKARWHGRNWLEDLVNRTMYRHYRRLERSLVEKGLVPREQPLWCLASGRNVHS